MNAVNVPSWNKIPKISFLFYDSLLQIVSVLKNSMHVEYLHKVSFRLENDCG